MIALYDNGGKQSNAETWPSECLGYTARALRLTGRGHFVYERLPATGSQKDFALALQVLGAELGAPRPNKPQRMLRILTARLSCPYLLWREVFGDLLECERLGRGIASTPSFRWKHRCADGVVLCTAYLFDRTPGVPWVLLRHIQFA